MIGQSYALLFCLLVFSCCSNGDIKLYDSTNDDQKDEIREGEVCFAVGESDDFGKRLYIGKTVVFHNAKKYCELEPEFNQQRPNRDEEFYSLSFDGREDIEALDSKSIQPLLAERGKYTELSLIAFVKAEIVREIREVWGVGEPYYSLVLDKDTGKISAYVSDGQYDDDLALEIDINFSKGRKRTRSDSDESDDDEGAHQFDKTPYESRTIEGVKLVRQISGTWVVNGKGAEVTGERMKTKPEKIKLGKGLLQIKTEKPAGIAKIRDHFLQLLAKAYLKDRNIKCGAFDENDRAALKGVKVIKKAEHGNEAWRIDED